MIVCQNCGAWRNEFTKALGDVWRLSEKKLAKRWLGKAIGGGIEAEQLWGGG